MRAGDQYRIGLSGYLVLQDQNGSRREHAVWHRFRIGERVCAVGDRDAVLAVGVDQNRRGARRRCGALDAVEVDAARRQQGKRGVGEGIGSDRAVQPDRSARARTGSGSASGSPATAMVSAAGLTKVSSGNTVSTASSIAGAVAPAACSTLLPTLAAGKFASAITNSSPWPIAASACSRSACSSGWIPLSI